MFPNTRLRRLRQSPELRSMLQETRLDFRELIIPLFVIEGAGITEEISAMPGIYRYSIDRLLSELEAPVYHKIGGILLFGVPSQKDDSGKGAWDEQGIVQQACREIKLHYPKLLLITDLCLCPYTSHGHCGLLDSKGRIDNDPTLEVLTKAAISHAVAGADIIAPSDMMDGRVGAIRQGLDQNGFQDKLILSYAAKFASAFYGPFREAAHSAPQFGDRKSYQMPPANRREALREMEEDVMEGADLMMVKPALAYLDILNQARNRFDVPLVAYNVSGEYAMVKAAAQAGWISEEQIVEETLISIKRAGADLIITYHAKDFYRWKKVES
ncbi:MAG TPA: porphobilinogen synthase [Firmicutes bacterium]|jgi:porphobilinogen synthase|nr:porphobilinogen synthase [Bacillota bacterium]